MGQGVGALHDLCHGRSSNKVTEQKEQVVRHRQPCLRRARARSHGDRETKSTKGSPFSIRLTEATDRFVATEARRTKRSKSAIVEALTEEAARMRRFPGIGFRGADAERRPWVIGTGLDVWQIIEAYRDFGSTERMVAETDLSERQIGIATAYHQHYPEEIDEAIADNRRSLDELRELFPFIPVTYVDLEAGSATSHRGGVKG